LPYGINSDYNGIIGDWQRQSNRLVSCIFLRPERLPSTYFIAGNLTHRGDSIAQSRTLVTPAKPSENALLETNLATEFCGVIGVGSFFRPVVTSTKTR
jgi:hypothetical protein